MKPCTRVGLDVTKRCNWRCAHCFYRWAKDFNKPYDKPLDELLQETMDAFARGCDHAVIVGWGEPTLYKPMNEFIEHCKDIGMATSIITNGCAPIPVYEEYFKRGLDHLHLSVHGTHIFLDEIAGNPSAWKKQNQTIEWLSKNGLPWRANMTLQAINYKQLSFVTEYCAYNGASHFIPLGFLPHYEWGVKDLKKYAVHPGELRSYIEDSIFRCEMHGMFCTVRYHPFCHLKPEYWKYIVNARYVLFDPWEWDYGHCGKPYEETWKAAWEMGDSVAVKGKPCCDCAVRLHCGGWNEVYAKAFDGADLMAVPKDAVPFESLTHAGYFHELNPVNSLTGTLQGEKVS